MKRAAILALIFLVGCATKNNGSDNVFYIGGKRTEIAPELMADLRSRWEAPFQISASSVLQPKDIRWALDFISISEAINNKECKHLKFIVATPYSEIKDGEENHAAYYKAQPGGFDYAWSISVCGSVHKYRIVQNVKAAEINVIPISL